MPEVNKDFIDRFVKETDKKFDNFDKKLDMIFEKIEKLSSFNWKTLGVATGVSCTVSLLTAVVVLYLRFK